MIERQDTKQRMSRIVKHDDPIYLTEPFYDRTTRY